MFTLGDSILSPGKSANLILDPPLWNPLRGPLRISALSSPLPKRATRVRWREARAVVHPSEPTPGGGGAFVRFLPADGPRTREAAVEDPWELDGQGRIRVWIELVVPPATGELWDPPWIDSIRLAWEAF